MDGFQQFTLLWVLTASWILQFSASFFAIRLTRLSRYHISWITICIALVLMTLRQTVTFYHLLAVKNYSADLHAEIAALLISLLLAAGLFFIAPPARRIYARPDVSDGASSDDLFERIPSGVMVCSSVDKGRDFTIIDINPAAERIEKTAREHLSGRRLSEVFPGMEAFGLPDVLRRVWKTGQPERFPMHYYKDDRISGWRDAFVYRRSSGEVVAVYNDVSAQMYVQEERDRCERKCRMLFERAPVPYQVLDHEGRIIEVNPAWLHLTGLNRAAAIGRPFSELLTRTGRQKFEACLNGLAKDGSSYELLIELRRNDGVLFEVEADILSLHGRTGGVEQLCGVLREKSGTAPDLKAEVEKQVRLRAAELLAGERRELQRQRLAMLGELVSNMAHELNTPLAAARNAFSLMRHDIAASSRQREFADMAAGALSRMADMIERMYRLHEPVSRECEPLNINAQIDNALMLVKPQMKARRIQLRDERAGKLPSVMLPPGAVMLALINPIKNSIEAMSPGGVLTLRTGVADLAGVFVEIEDNGPGMPEEFISHLFEPFTTFRQDGGGQGGSGLGLGMAVVQRTLDVLGGSVTVRSNPGEGTRVHVVLPAEMKQGI